MFSGLAGPLALISACCAVCLCARRCGLRDCACIKTFLRVIGHDKFDDFELMVLVHEAIFEHKDAKMATNVRITAGPENVITDEVSNGIYQQPLHIMVHQGTEQILVELLAPTTLGFRVLANLKLDTLKDVLGSGSMQAELLHEMKPKDKGILHPKIKLTIVAQDLDDDAEKGLMPGAMGSDVDILVRQQLRKAKEEGKDLDGGLSEMEVLKHACAGPLESFEGLGKTQGVYVGVIGPPTSRHWLLGVWMNKSDFESKNPPMVGVDLLKVQSVQADPERINVFVVNYFDAHRVHQALTFRRVDRARDVWVEILHIIVVKAHEEKHSRKTVRATGNEGGRNRKEKKTKSMLW